MTDYSLAELEAELARRESPSVSAPTQDYSLSELEAELARRESAIELPETESGGFWDWYTTRPDGSQPPVKDQILGPVTSAGNALTFNLMDEVAAGGSALLQGDVPYYGDDSIFEQKLDELRGAERGFREASPGVALALDLPAVLKQPFKSGIGSRATIAGKTAQAAKEGAAYGAAYGFGGGESTEDRLYGAGAGAGVGALAGGGLTAAGAGISKGASAIGKAASDMGRKLELSAFGAGKSAIKKANKNQYDLFEGGAYKNPISRAIATFRKDGGNKVGDDAADILQELERQEAKYGDELTKLLGKAEGKQKDVIIPEFRYTDEYINSLPGVDKAAARKIADEAITNTTNNLDGTLTSLQREKVALSNRIKEAAWDKNADSLQTEIRKRVYGDLRRTIEDGFESVTGESGQAVRELNDQIAMRLRLNDIFTDALNTSESANVVNRVLQVIRTSGGGGVAALVGASALGPAGALIGPAIAYYATTPRGKIAIADALRGHSKEAIQAAAENGGEILSIVGPKLMAAMQRDSVSSMRPEDPTTGENRTPEDPNKSDFPSSSYSPKMVDSSNGLKSLIGMARGKPELPAASRDTFNTLINSKPKSNTSPVTNGGRSMDNDKAPKMESISYELERPELGPLVKAVIKVESNGNPKAESHAGAQGLMQLMPEIQKAFGVTDPFDVQQNVTAGERLLVEELRRFGDVELALAAYNAGSPAVRRAIKKAGGARDFQAIKKYLPKETQDYVPKVLRAYEVV